MATVSLSSQEAVAAYQALTSLKVVHGLSDDQDALRARLRSFIDTKVTT